MKKIYSLPVLVEKKLAELKPLKLQTERVTIKEAKIKPLKISLWHLIGSMTTMAALLFVIRVGRYRRNCIGGR